MEGAVVALALLACPVGMGLMMWFMGKSMKKDKLPATPSSVEDLRTEHARIAAQIEEIEPRPPAQGQPERVPELRNGAPTVR